MTKSKKLNEALKNINHAIHCLKTIELNEKDELDFAMAWWKLHAAKHAINEHQQMK